MAELELGAIISDDTPARLPRPESLLGNHVILECLSTRHVADLYDTVGSVERLWTYIPAGPFANPSDFASFLHDAIEGKGQAHYAVLLETGGKAVGILSLIDANVHNRTIEVGLIYGKDLQRTRAGTEAMYLLCKLVLDELGYRRSTWICNSLNEPSRKAAERYGFVYEGTLRQDRIVKGRNRDTCLHSMLDREWLVCKAAFETWLSVDNFDKEGKQMRSLNEVRNRLVEDKG